MPQPTTGVDWNEAGFQDIDNNFLERGKRVQVLVRDDRGTATDISPHNADGSIRYSPFAVDGTWRKDLVAHRKINGYWVKNTEQPNGGWHIGGAFKEGDGPTNKPGIKNDDFMVEQLDVPFDSDLVEQSEPFSLTPVETLKPVVRRLRDNLPLNSPTGDSLVEDPGQLSAVWARPLDADAIGRQFLIVRQYTKGGLPVLVAKGYALAKMSDIGNSKSGKKDSEAAELTYNPLPHSSFMALQDGIYRPVLRATWVGGAGWVAFGGIPVVSLTVPTATPAGTGAGTVSFPEPTGTGDPWSYKVQFSTDNGVTWQAAIAPSAVAVNTGVVTLSFTGVAAGSKKFRGQVTGSNGAVAATPASAAVTIT